MKKLEELALIVLKINNSGHFKTQVEFKQLLRGFLEFFFIGYVDY